MFAAKPADTNAIGGLRSSDTSYEIWLFNRLRRLTIKRRYCLLKPCCGGAPEDLLAAVKAFGATDVKFKITATAPFVPRALKLKLMLGVGGAKGGRGNTIIHTTKSKIFIMGCKS